MVLSLWRYPVKSMIGEEVDSSLLTERGLSGDRAFALLDLSTGRVASAKNPRKWGKLFEFHASSIEMRGQKGLESAVRIDFPDGTSSTSDRPGLDDRLSEALGTRVHLISSAPEDPRYEEYWPDLEGLPHRDTVTDESMPPRSFFDLGVVHVLTTSTLGRLHERYPEGRFEVRRFRPNIVIQPGSERDEIREDRWVDRVVCVGPEVRLKIMRPCLRCVMTTLPQGDLPRDLGILRTVAALDRLRAGVYASVEQGGTVTRGDEVRVG